KMPTDQVRIRSLYAGLYGTIAQFGLLVAGAWLFALFSYYLSRKTGIDWFARSGSVMALAGAAVTFRLANFYHRRLAADRTEGLVRVASELVLGLAPPRFYAVLSYLGYLTGIVGTAIWGYGALLIGPGI